MDDGRRWEHFEHGADIGVRGIGPSLATAFEQAARALTAVIVDPATVEAREAVDIACEAPDQEVLLVDWLNALVYEMAARGVLFRDFSVRIDGSRLTATAWGEPVQMSRHRPVIEVKGATFTRLNVRGPDDGVWTAECVVDV